MAWSVLQSAVGSASPGLNATATFTAANASAGTKIIAAIAFSAAAGNGTITSVQDAALNNLTLIATVANGVAETTAIYAMDTPAGDVGIKPAIKVSVTNSLDIGILVQEVSGLVTGNTLAAMVDGTPGTLTGTNGASTGSPTYSSTAVNEYLVAVYGDNGGPETWVKPAALTADTNSVNTSSFADIAISYGNSTNGAEAGSYAISGTAAQWGVILCAFKVAAGGGPPATLTPQRYGQPAPQSRAPWQQHDLRDANTVATAANPNVPPLDSAWQADARYWHLYNDTAARDRRAYFQQRPYVSYPGFILPAAPFDPLLAASQDTQRRYFTPAYYDRREVPQQKDRRNAITLGIAAPITDPTVSAHQDRLRRSGLAATHADRREVPQQRSYPDRQPDGSYTAGIGTVQAWWSEDVLAYQAQRTYFTPPPVQIDVGVGSGTTEAWWGVDSGPYYVAQRRYVSDPRFTPADPTTAGVGTTQAWWSDDVLAFQSQRPYAFDPALTVPAVGDVPGGGTDLFPAAYVDRRSVPQQRPYVSGPTLLDSALLEPPLIGGATSGQRASSPASNADRREVPQQRAYVSDPSSYPTVGSIDPLTVAWGAGGRYWLLYNQPAELVDRRAVPQQRAYVSDPNLLLTALLENELLGGAGTAQRYQLAAEAVDRREVPQQRLYVSDPSTYPTQATIDPTTVAWGAGGRYWLLYNQAAATVDRRLVPQQRAYLSVPGLLDTALLENELLGGADDQRRRYGQAAYYDRRLVPQQRVAYADPAGPVTDPLLIAWGAGGRYALLYQTAAWAVDRRTQGRQRAYVSDPALLTTALLESALLGGADDLRRRYHEAALYADRREVPQQRAYLSVPGALGTLLEGALLGGATTWLRATGAAYYDRREVPQQRAYLRPGIDLAPTQTPGLLVVTGDLSVTGVTGDLATIVVIGDPETGGAT